jgi:drug/metabolite transporter (DMT)-like permease
MTATSRQSAGIRWVSMLLFAFVCALWGLNFVAAKVSLRFADPLFLAAVRMTATGVVLLALARMSTGRWLCRRGLGPALLAFGLFNCFGLQALMYAAQTHVSAGLGGIILYTYPVITAVGARFLLSERLTRLKVFGIVCGFAGVALVAGFGRGSGLGELEMSGAAVCWAVGTIVFKRYLGGENIYLVSGWAFVFAGLMAGVALGATGSFSVRSDPALWWWLAFSIIGGSVITNAIWLQLLKRDDAGVAAAQLFMTPLFSLLFGWLLLSEHAGASQLAGAVLVAFGIVLVNKVRRGPEAALVEHGPSTNTGAGGFSRTGEVTA